jgi:hypothetical protein
MQDCGSSADVEACFEGIRVKVNASIGKHLAEAKADAKAAVQRRPAAGKGSNFLARGMHGMQRFRHYLNDKAQALQAPRRSSADVSYQRDR